MVFGALLAVTDLLTVPAAGWAAQGRTPVVAGAGGG